MAHDEGRMRHLSRRGGGPRDRPGPVVRRGPPRRRSAGASSTASRAPTRGTTATPWTSRGTPARSQFQAPRRVRVGRGAPQAAYITSEPRRASPGRTRGGSPAAVVNAEGTSLAAAGTRIVVGWVTGFSPYDPAGAPRRLRSTRASTAGATWRGIKSLTPAWGRIDYPVVAAAKDDVRPGQPVRRVGSTRTNGKVYFRERSGAGAWSVPLVIGLHDAAGSRRWLPRVARTSPRSGT
jgi:hypothetical protein